MFKNNKRIPIRRDILFCICIICLIFASMGLVIENSSAADLNTTSDEIGTQIDTSNIEENSQNNEILEVDSQEEILNANERTPKGNKFSDIQTCINGAANGDTILLSGTYYADNANSQILVNKQLTITSNNGAILDGLNKSAVFYASVNNVVFNNLKIINANAQIIGSAIYTDAKNVMVQNSVFENNRCRNGGVVGTIYDINKAENFKIYNCNFTNNLACPENPATTASAGGLGVYSFGVEVVNCIFDSNTAKSTQGSFGGAIHIGMDDPNYHASVKNCIFKNNKAVSIVDPSHGGAGCVRNGVEYTNCTFINNTADQGGALTMHASGVIANCTFIDNSATTLYGGAVSSGFLFDKMNLVIENCSFDGNAAPLGGAIQVKGLNITIVDSEFNNNHADNYGGAVNINANNVLIENSEFNHNIAEIDGGAIFINGKRTSISDSSFISNHAVPDKDKLDDGLGGAIYINSTEAVITNNNFTFNTARNGSAIYYDKYGRQLILLKNILYQNQAWIYRLPIYSEDIYYGDDEEIKVIIYGGNNIANYNNLGVSNAIYNAANSNQIEIDGQNPVDGATDDGRLYQDDREYNIAILLTVNHEDGTIVYNDSLNSSYLGEINIVLDNLKPGKYFVSAQHFEDTYYKGITNVSSFNVYPKVDNKITISTNSSTFNFEDVVIWTINVTNFGPNNSTGVIAYNVIPEGLIWLNDTCKGKYDSKTGILNISELNVNETLTFKIITVVDKTGDILNQVNITAKEEDINMTNNFDEKIIHINPASDLSVIKTPSTKNPNYKDKVDWTITVTNNGPDTAHNVTVNDLLPKSLIYIDCDGDYDAETGIWNIGTLENGKTITLTIKCIVNETGLAQNNVTVNGSEFDYDLTNNHDEEFIYANPASDLSIVKSVNMSVVNYQDIVKWTLTISNNGPDNATNVKITDILPNGFIHISSTLDYVNNTFTIKQVNVGQTITIELISKVNTTGNYTNTANITSDEYDPDLTNNEDEEPISINPASDLMVTKTVSDSNPEYHDNITWTIVVTNNGPDTAHDIKIQDILPDSLIWIDDDSLGKYDPLTGELTLDCLNSSDEFTLNIECMVNGTGLIQNNVTVNGLEFDYNLTNNQDNETIDVEASADVNIVKIVNNPTPNYNDLVTWTLIISNNGPDNATNIYVEDVLPEGLILVNYTATKGIYDRGLWVMCCLQKGEEQRLNIICRVNKTGKITNIATIHADEYDSDVTNNQDNETIDVPLAVDIQVKIIVDNEKPLFAEPVNWMITVTNNGPDNATNVVLYDIFPEELIFDEYNSTKGVYSSGQWSVGSLNVGEIQYLNITTIPNALGEIINNVNVESEEYDWNMSNNYDDSAIDVKPVADLSVIKTVNNPNPKYGEQVKWTIKVYNKGPNTANNVRVFETLPNGLTFIKSNGNYADGIWSVGTLNVDETKELEIICKVTSTGNHMNIVDIVSDEFDPNLTDNHDDESIDVSPASDLSVTKIASKYKYVVDDVIEYVIEVVNNGPDTAHNIKISEILDDLLHLKSFKVTKGSFNKFSLTWSIDSLRYGEFARLYIKAIAMGAGILKNTVLVTSDTFDYNLDNNEDFAMVDVDEITPNKTSDDYKGVNGHSDRIPYGILEKHVTANPFWILVLSLVFSLIFLNGNISKKR